MREKAFLRQRYATMLSCVGQICVLCGLVTLTPLLGLVAWPEQGANAPAFLAPAGCLILLGLLAWRLSPATSRATLTLQEGGVIVCTSWLAVMLVSSWPFMALEGLGFSRAFFESVSGWTTTGLSVVDVAAANPLTLLWRSTIQLAGGAGLAVVMMSSIVGAAGAGITNAEGRGEQLVPNVRRSARLVLTIYGCYALAGTLAYRVVGMTWFDALNHAFCAVSTGGFSTRVTSIGYWDSVLVEAVTVPLMLLGNLSFVTAWFLWRGKWRVVARNGEVRLQGAVLLLTGATLLCFTCVRLYPGLGKALRVAVFETVTALTTTGFSTVSYADWNATGILVLIVLMIIGGGTCSTAGGLKQFRVHLLWRSLLWECKRAVLPRGAVLGHPVWEGERQVFLDEARFRQLAAFVFLYLIILAVGTLILCSCGYGLGESLFEFASALGTVGLSVGVTSASMPQPALWAETLAMFCGRLEFLVLITSVLKCRKDVLVLLQRPSGA